VHLDALLKRISFVQKAFRSRFRGTPAVRVLAPTCAELLGAHTFTHSGLLLPVAVDHTVLLAVRPRSDKKVILHFLQDGVTLQFSLYHLKPQGRMYWGKYVQSVGWWLRKQGYTIRGIEGVVHSEILPDASIGYWPPVEVALLWAWNTLDDLGIPKEEVASFCATAEQEFIGSDNIRVAHWAAALSRHGHAMQLDCETEEYSYHPILPQAKILLCDANARPATIRSMCHQRQQEAEEALALLRAHSPRVQKWSDVDGDELERHRALLPEDLYRRARFLVTERARVQAGAQALDAGDLERLGELLNASYRAQREDYQVTSQELDILWELVNKAGAYGARLLEGCYGGYIIAVVPAYDLNKLTKFVTQEYRTQTGREVIFRPVEATDSVLVV